MTHKCNTHQCHGVCREIGCCMPSRTCIVDSQGYSPMTPRPRYQVPSCSTMLDFSALILGKQKISERSFRALFGMPSLATKFIWDNLKEKKMKDRLYDLKKFFMTFNYLKEGSKMETFCLKWNMSHKTMMKWLHHGLSLIISTLPDVSISLSKYAHSVDLLFLNNANFFSFLFFFHFTFQLDFLARLEGISEFSGLTGIVDTFKCQIAKPNYNSWEYLIGTHLWGLKYEIVCSIGNPHIVWIAGPYKGAAHDHTISKDSGLVNALLPGEHLLADLQYRHETKYMCPISGHRYTLPEWVNAYNYLVYASRQSVERLIGRVRNWGFASEKYNGQDYGFHHQCMLAIFKLTNVALCYERLG
jgi:hypothetical protein